MADQEPGVPVFFRPQEKLNTKERTEQKQREYAEIIRWQYRFLKLDAVKPGETTDAFQIRSLNKRLVHLEREKAQKELRVKIANAPVHRREAKSSRATIRRLLGEVASYEAKIDAVKIDMNELCSQIKRADVELKTSTKVVPSDSSYVEALLRSRKELVALENRLHNVRVLVGKQHDKNRKLRAHIEQMLRERKQYNLLWMEHVHDLNRNRKFLLDMIERATLAFNQGEDLCHRIESLKAEELRDKRARMQEMVEVERQIVGTRRMNEFLRTKGLQRPVADLDPLLVRNRDLFKQAHAEKVQSYSTVIKNTKEYMHLEDMQNVLMEIEKQQDKYIALFRYTNLANAKILEANGIAHDLQKDSERLLEADQRKRYSDERKARQDVKQYHTARKQTNEMKESVAYQQESLDLKLATVKHALSLVGYDRAKIVHMMAGSSASDPSRLTTDSVNMLLTTIEHRVLEMVRVSSPAPEVPDDVVIGSLYERHQCAECAEGQDVNQHDERLVVPLDYPQLLENVQKRMTAPGMQYRLHTLSQCKLPRSRMLVNKRYQ